MKGIVSHIFLLSMLLMTWAYPDTISVKENSGQMGYQAYQIFLISYFVMMIVTIFKGYGENRIIIIFRDYNDLGLTFLIPVSFVLIYILFTSLGGDPRWGGMLGIIVALILFLILIRNSYIDNNRSLLYTSLAILTKMPLGIIWIVNLVSILNPSGKTAMERRKNRGSALVILTLLTPIVAMLVVEKKGSFFNPKDWIRGKQIGSVKNHL